MNFRPGDRDEPEINLIPFIDILLVVLIFLMLTTTYSKFTELKVNLPVADAEAQRQNPKEVIVTASAERCCAKQPRNGGGHQRRRHRNPPVGHQRDGRRATRRSGADHIHHPATGCQPSTVTL
jgi:hypothetical protein